MTAISQCPQLDRLQASRGLSFVELEQSSESFAPADAAAGAGGMARGKRDDVGQALVVTLAMVVHDKLVDGAAEMTLSERNDVPQTLLPDGSNKALRTRIQIGAVGGQPQQFHVRRRKQSPEVLRVERSRSTIS